MSDEHIRFKTRKPGETEAELESRDVPTRETQAEMTRVLMNLPSAEAGLIWRRFLDHETLLQYARKHRMSFAKAAQRALKALIFVKQRVGITDRPRKR
jgi:hypothetical protein